jgi:hypothetical protein
MTKQLSTLWLIGFMAAVLAPAAGCIETVHDHDHGGGGAACLDYQYFTVQWGIDHGPGTLPLTCSQINSMASYVQLSTNAAPPDSVLTPQYNLICQDGATCSDGSPCNMSADTVSGLPVGTYVTAATLVGSDGSQLSTSPGQGPGYAISSCDGYVLPYIFAVAP